jgi:hypothetical protein
MWEDPKMPAKNEAVLRAIRQEILAAEARNEALNAYRAAETILQSMPDLELQLTDLVDMMIEMPGIARAVELTPPAAIIEIICEEESEEPASRLA